MTTPQTIIRWLGHACFLISFIHANSITKVLIDPPHPEVGYAIAAHSIPTNAVFVSHEHQDHNFIEAAEGGTVIQPLTDPNAPSVHGSIQANNNAPLVTYDRIFAYHDNQKGALRGPDTISVIHANGLSICHLGDLGQLQLTPAQINAIGHVDILMIPVGGYFTIDGNQAVAIVKQLHPRIIIPMHYQTPQLNQDLHSILAPVTVFLNAMKGNADVVKVQRRDLKLAKSLPKRTTIYLLPFN